MPHAGGTARPTRRRSLRRAAALVALALGACSDDAPTAAPPTTTTTAAAPVSSDLAFLAEQIEQRHPDPPDVRAGDDPSDPDELLVAAMRLANLGAGEGHGGVYPWAQPELDAWPVHLYDFGADGLRAVAGDGAPIGARLVAVGDAPIEEVVDAVRPLVPHDNDATVLARLPAYLAFPAVLRGLGFDPSTLTWVLPDGSTSTMAAPTTVSAGAFAELLGLFQPQVPPSLPYDRERRFWSEARGDAVYVRWNQVQRADGDTSLAELATALVDAVTSGAATRVVIDARHNPGGEIPAAAPLALAVREIDAIAPGAVRFVVGRSTFSAASHTIAGLLPDTASVLVGEPMGGSAESYADPVRVELPGSGIVAFVNTGPYRSGAGGVDALAPDVAVALSWDDWSAGRDPVLDAAIGAS